MYAPLFASLYQGSMSGKSDLLLVWPCLLAHADPRGNIDMHPRVISALTGLSIDRVEAALLELEADDPDSRTRDETYGGRRLVRLDEGKRWGWFVVNHALYRDLATLGKVRAQAAERQARKREKDRHAQSRSVTEPSRSRHATVTAGRGRGKGKGVLQDSSNPSVPPRRADAAAVEFSGHEEPATVQISPVEQPPDATENRQDEILGIDDAQSDAQGGAEGNAKSTLSSSSTTRTTFTSIKRRAPDSPPGWFVSAWRAHYDPIDDESPRMPRGAAVSLVRALQRLGKPTAEAVLGRYFADPNKHLATERHPPGLLTSSRIERYLHEIRSEAPPAAPIEAPPLRIKSKVWDQALAYIQGHVDARDYDTFFRTMVPIQDDDEGITLWATPVAIAIAQQEHAGVIADAESHVCSSFHFVTRANLAQSPASVVRADATRDRKALRTAKEIRRT